MIISSYFFVNFSFFYFNLYMSLYDFIIFIIFILIFKIMFSHYYLLIFNLFISFLHFTYIYFILLCYNFSSLYIILCCPWYVIILDLPLSHHKLFRKIFETPRYDVDPPSIKVIICLYPWQKMTQLKKWNNAAKKMEGRCNFIHD